MKYKCISCEKNGLSGDTIGINKKILGTNIDEFYCIDCFANYLECTTEELLDKIEEFKDEDCILFKGEKYEI